MKIKTEGESLFETFCIQNAIEYCRISETTSKTPDYEFILYGQKMVVEIKQIDEDEDFNIPDENGSSGGLRKPGSHVRRRIESARDQIRDAAEKGYPALLLIHNNLDGTQIFGTEHHDFISGMFGEITVNLNIETGEVSEAFQGKNAALQKTKNVNFSAIGHLSKKKSGAMVHIFENPFAKNEIDFLKLPSCVAWNKIKHPYAT